MVSRDSIMEQPGSGPTSRRAKMVQAELLGAHAHETGCGVRVYVWKRGDVYLARGRFQRRQFGKSLGTDPSEAGRKLGRLLVEIENSTFQPPALARRLPLKSGQAPRLTVRELCNRYLAETRKLRGAVTARNYQSRLVPLIEFSERLESRRRWPFASDVDREFAIQFRSTLYTRIVTRNGHSAATERTISPRHVYTILDCVRSMLNWAKKPDVLQLACSFVNPFTQDIVGNKPRKDPLRPIPIPMATRIALVELMDSWQLCQFAIPLVLPLRPEDFIGLLISEVNFENRQLRFGTRFEGRDFNKGRQSFTILFPGEVAQLLRVCVNGRTEGPLLRRRAIWDGRTRPSLRIESRADFQSQLDQAFAAASGNEICTEQDAKRSFRGLLRKMGGVSGDELGKGFKPLLKQLGVPSSIRFYDLRSSCTTEMNRSGMSDLMQRYVTGHSIGSDILASYVTLDNLSAEMEKYFDSLRPLLTAIKKRADLLGIPHADH